MLFEADLFDVFIRIKVLLRSMDFLQHTLFLHIWVQHALYIRRMPKELMDKVFKIRKNGIAHLDAYSENKAVVEKLKRELEEVESDFDHIASLRDDQRGTLCELQGW